MQNCIRLSLSKRGRDGPERFRLKLTRKNGHPFSHIAEMGVESPQVIDVARHEESRVCSCSDVVLGTAHHVRFPPILPSVEKARDGVAWRTRRQNAQRLIAQSERSGARRKVSCSHRIRMRKTCAFHCPISGAYQGRGPFRVWGGRTGGARRCSQRLQPAQMALRRLSSILLRMQLPTTTAGSHERRTESARSTRRQRYILRCMVDGQGSRSRNASQSCHLDSLLQSNELRAFTNGTAFKFTEVSVAKNRECRSNVLRTESVRLIGRFRMRSGRAITRRNVRCSAPPSRLN